MPATPPDPAALTAELVRIDSVNPALDPSHEGEARAARHVASWGRAHGLEVRTFEPVAGRPSVHLWAHGSGGGRTLMLNAHLDTVGVTGMEAPFQPVVRDGRMYGRGTMDMKASLAACMVAVAEAAGQPLRGDVVLTAVADEEHASIGTADAVGRIRADGAIVTEPTDLALHVAHRGFSVFELTLQGRASHTSRPEEGVNALTHLGRVLAEVESRDAALRARPPHALLGHGSLQAVLASGGHELFTTPASASLTLERRTLPGERPAEVRAELEGLLAALSQRDATLRGRLESLVEREPFEAPEESEVEAALTQALVDVRGAPPQRLGAPYWTDAALVAGAGIPTVLFGVVGGGIHRPDEWVDVESIGTVTRVLERTIRSFCA